MIDPSKLSALDRAAIQQHAATLQAVATRLQPMRDLSAQLASQQASLAAAAKPILEAVSAISATYLDTGSSIAASVADIQTSWAFLGEDIRLALASNAHTFEAIRGQLRSSMDASRLFPALQTAFATATPAFVEQLTAASATGTVTPPAPEQAAAGDLLAQVQENATFLFWLALLYIVLFGGGYVLGADLAAAGNDRATASIRDAVSVASLVLYLTDKVLKGYGRSADD